MCNAVLVVLMRVVIKLVQMLRYEGTSGRNVVRDEMYSGGSVRDRLNRAEPAL